MVDQNVVKIMGDPRHPGAQRGLDHGIELLLL